MTSRRKFIQGALSVGTIVALPCDLFAMEDWPTEFMNLTHDGTDQVFTFTPTPMNEITFHGLEYGDFVRLRDINSPTTVLRWANVYWTGEKGNDTAYSRRGADQSVWVDLPDKYLMDFKLPNIEWQNVTVHGCNTIKINRAPPFAFHGPAITDLI